MKLKDALALIEQTPGLKLLKVLSMQERMAIAAAEQQHNTGVHECLKKQHVLLVSHDSSFRLPPSAVMLENNQGIEFPPVAFPEIAAAMSASPSEKVHHALIQNIEVALHPEEATLLIGFDEYAAHLITSK